jgi:ferredoxin, 2Fe-2S
VTRIVVVDGSGQERQIECKDGRTLMEALRDMDNGVAAICGGMCSCATCHVYVDDAWTGRLPAQQTDERELLESLVHRRPQSRLSCQIPLQPDLDGLMVQIAPDE